MATGDVVLRLDQISHAPKASTPEELAAFERQFAAKMRAEMYPEQAHAIDPAIAEEARRERIKQAEMRRAEEKPVPEPWDAWRNQRAPALFEAEVTNRG